jgi:transposase-like protein
MSNGISLIAVQKAFGTEEQCIAYLKAVRWADGPVTCLECGKSNVSEFITNETSRERFSKRLKKTVEVRVPARHLFQCKDCKYQFSATTGTIFDKSHIPLSKWFQATALIVNAKKSLSAMQMERDLGVTYRTAWFLNHRIREAMQSKGGLFGGEVELDATYHGGRYDVRRHRARRDKQAIMGVVQRGIEEGPSQVKAFLVPGETAPVVKQALNEHVSFDAKLYSDEHGAYRHLAKSGRHHEIVIHSVGEYVRGRAHTNTVENFWSLFKRGVIGSFHFVSVRHLQRYLNEFQFRFNNRQTEDLFGLVITNLAMGTALRYKVLTAKPDSDNARPSQI